MFRSNAVTIPAGEEYAVALAEVLSLLDPRETATIRLLPTDDENGLYLIQFSREQLFDPDVFPAEVFELIEDVAEQMGLVESHLAAV